jgi:FdhD protein
LDGLTRKVSVTRLAAGRTERIDDPVVIESAVPLVLNGDHLLTFACLPERLAPLAAGFLFTEGIAPRPGELDIRTDGTEGIVVEGDIDAEALARSSARWTLTTGCGGGLSAGASAREGACRKIDTVLRAGPGILRALMKKLGDSAPIFRATGGTHVAGLGTAEGELLCVAEDIGRHNAVDKVVGQALLDGVGLGDLILCGSGRMSSEIVLKAVFAKTPILVSRSAPTSHSLALAEKFLLTMVGFVRGKRMNIYSHPQRLGEGDEGDARL